MGGKWLYIISNLKECSYNEGYIKKFLSAFNGDSSILTVSHRMLDT